MSRRSCGSPSAGRAGTGPNRALVAAGRGIAVITGGAVGLEAVRWAFGAGAAAGLGHVTDSHRRPTHHAGRLEAISWAGGIHSIASLGHITGPGCRATHHAGCLEAIGWAGGVHPIAGLGHVTGPGCRATHHVRGLELTGGRATEARLPVIRTQITLLGALHQPIATDGHADARTTTAAEALLDSAGTRAAVPVGGVAVVTLLIRIDDAVAAVRGDFSDLSHKGVIAGFVDVADTAAERRLHGIHCGEVRRGGPSSHVGTAGKVHGDALAEVTATATQVGGVDNSGAGRIQLGHEGVGED